MNAGKDELQRLEEEDNISASDLSTYLTHLDNAATLTPADFEVLHNSVLAGQVGLSLYQVATGDTDGAFETAFDTLVPLVAKHILTKAGAGAIGGPVGLLLSLVLSLGPMDTSGTRVAAFSENTGEINPTGQRTYPGGYGTQINGNGFADPMYRGWWLLTSEDFRDLPFWQPASFEVLIVSMRQDRLLFDLKKPRDRSHAAFSVVCLGRLSRQVLIEERDGALPGESGCGFVIAGRGVVVEAVIGALIEVHHVGLAVFIERSFVGRPTFVDALV